MSPLFMLDTNIVSVIVKRRSQPALKRLAQAAVGEICVSTITEAELLYGLARRPEAHQLAIAIHGFLENAVVMPWDSAVAAIYARLRWELDAKGRPLGPLDMLIAAHALQAGATLVSNDRAFQGVASLNVDDWTLP